MVAGPFRRIPLGPVAMASSCGAFCYVRSAKHKASDGSARLCHWDSLFQVGGSLEGLKPYVYIYVDISINTSISFSNYFHLCLGLSLCPGLDLCLCLPMSNAHICISTCALRNQCAVLREQYCELRRPYRGIDGHSARFSCCFPAQTGTNSKTHPPNSNGLPQLAALLGQPRFLDEPSGR